MLDWAARTLLLILSGLSTFAIIMALMAAGEIRGGTQPRAEPTPAAGMNLIEPSANPIELAAEPGANLTDPAATGPDEPRLVQVPKPRDPIERWLEALTYAVLALAGFAAAGLLVLLRITFHLSAIARQRN